MNTIQHWKTIIDNWELYEEYPSIYSFILFSPLDKNMIEYFSNFEYWSYLDGISTNRCLNFIIADANPEFPNWSNLIDENYEPPKFYEIADAFGIDEDQIPCLIFFRDIESRLKERIVYSIDRYVDPQGLRMIFDKIYKKIERQDVIYDGVSRKRQREKAYSDFKKALRGEKVVKWIRKAGKWIGKETIKALVKETFE